MKNLLKVKNILILIITCVFLYEIIFVQIDPAFYMVSLDVGQGDSTLIITQDKKIILIDTGPPNLSSLDELARYFPIGKNTIDLMIISHFDSDHIGSLKKLMNNYAIKMIAYNPMDPDMNNDWVQTFSKFSSFSPVAGQFSKVGCCVKIEWLWPIENIKETDSNSSSLALKLTYGSIDIFFGGDSPIKIEESLKQIGDIDILKVSHHGSNTSTSELFLNSITPEYSIISVGKNSYGHPSSNVIDKLKKMKVKTFRTDEAGTQIFIINNNEIRTYSSYKCKYFCSYILAFKQKFD